MYDCLVIGGGISGISTLYNVSKYSNNILLLESRPFLGGRARSFVDTISGDEIDNGQHILMNCYDNFLQLLENLGTRRLVITQNRMKVPFLSKNRNSKKGYEVHFLKQQFFSNKLGTLVGLLSYSAFSILEKYSLIVFMLGLKIFPPKSCETVLQYLKRRNVVQKLIDFLFEPITLATLNTSVEKASATLLSTVLQLALLSGGNRSSFVIPKTGLSHLFSKSSILQEYSKTSTTITTIERIEDYFVASDSKNNTYYTKSIVLATTISATKRFLSQLGSEHSLNEVDSPITSVYIWFDSEVLTEIDEPFFGLIGTVSQWIFNKYKIEVPTTSFAKSLVTIVISASDNLSDLTKDEIVLLLYSELSVLFPSIKSSSMLHSVVIKEKKATFLATPSFEAVRLDTSTKVKGVFLAGDWTNTSLPATLEGATLSGIKAANNVVSFLKEI